MVWVRMLRPNIRRKGEDAKRRVQVSEELAQRWEAEGVCERCAAPAGYEPVTETIVGVESILSAQGVQDDQ